MARNAKSKPVKGVRRFLPELLLFVGIFLVTVSTAHNIVRLRSLSLDKATVDRYIASESNHETRVIPTHIFIQWFVDTGIEQQIYVDNKWTISPDVASFLAQSAQPGTAGNTIIYGHNTRSILGNIRALKGSEQIELTLSDGSKKMYQVESLHEVSPTDTQLLRPTDSEVLTIYTCSGFMDSRRFVVRAVPII
jgi:LPXTG-site transpeptidase (sortase) family protein